MTPSGRSLISNCILGVVLSFAAASASAQDAPVAPKVKVVAAYMQEVTADRIFIARGEAVDKVDIVARVSGFVEQVPVKDGSTVKSGDLLFQIESGTYEATLAARKADKATADANLTLSEIELDRKTQLFERNAGTGADKDIATANNQVAEANILIANAAIDLAELDLSYTKVVAPFSGRIGRTNPSVGELVSPTTGPMVTLIRVSPMYVEFSLTEKQFVGILAEINGEAGRVEASENSPNVFAILPDGSELKEVGQLAFADNRIDPQTGSILVRAQFENELGMISDGSFLEVRIEAPEPVSKLMIPQAAVQRDQRGDFVLVVGTDQNVEQRYITSGRQVETALVVESGLKDGETVIVDGLQRVRPGVAVDPVVSGTTTEGQ